MEQFADIFCREVSAQSLSDIEVICTSKGDPEHEKEFDKSYPFRIHRVGGSFTRSIQESSKKFNTIVGGSELGAKGKLAMLRVALLSAISMSWTTARLFRRYRSRPLMVHAIGLSSLSVAVMCKKIMFLKQAKIIFTNQFTYKKSGFKLADKVISYILGNCDEIVCVAHYSAQQIVESFNVDPKKVTVAYSWMPIPEITEEIQKLLEHRDTHRINILAVTRVIPEKGIGEIIGLAKYIQDKGLDEQFAITVIGDSSHPIKDGLIDATHKYSCLRYVGRINKPELWKYYATSDVFFLPAKSDGEGSNRVIVEAYSLGVPVVATNYQAIAEMLALFPIAKTLNTLSADSTIAAIREVSEKLKRQGINDFLEQSRKVINSKFSSRNFSVYEDAYLKLLPRALTNAS